MDISETALALLPAKSRAKLEALMIERQAAVGAYRAASDREQEARRDAALIEARARERLAMPPGVEIDAHPATAVVAARKHAQQRSETEERLMQPVEAARRRLAIASDARERAAARQEAFAFLEGIETWLGRAASFGIGRLDHFAPKPPKTRDFPAESERIRRELAALDDAWQAAEGAPAPVSDLRDRFLAELDAIAAQGEPRVHATARAGSPVELARMTRIATMPVVAGGEAPSLALSGDAGASFFVWLMRDQIAAKIGAMIDAAPQAGALSDTEREARFAETSARRLELERIEEAAIVAAEAEGRIIARRRDADPRAVLEVREV
ncbi:hypothetical protein GGR16_002076 [Chelatococcus caeni]|uniref:Uncharacterized protein n=1 Tax=Chelatococcus caeni TaxID=1348468 RepID=A0A840C3P8_9HYPH|nr:hypothetical protein [Chelatococcus caeni]MBB4017047.1 hypothetical protein [Chelatococcus caeni]